jgi:hypothetical protein
MPNNSDETARILCTAGSWLKAREPLLADRFYKALVRRCRKTVIGAKADEIRWFPELDPDGNLWPEMGGSLTPEEISDRDAIMKSDADEIASAEEGSLTQVEAVDEPLPPPVADPQSYVVQKGDSPAKIAGEFGINLKMLFEANPGLNSRRFEIGQKLLIPDPAR